MTYPEATAIFQSLLNGIDPVTGEILPYDHLCRSPQVSQALSLAFSVLTGVSAYFNASAALKGDKLHAGRSWSQEELAALERMYCAGIPMDEICQRLQRREQGVKRQLAYLGLTEQAQPPGQEAGQGVSRAGSPWTRAEDVLVEEMYRKREPISHIAAAVRRSEYAIFCRMEKLGLYGEEWGYPPEEKMQPYKASDKRLIYEMFQAGKPVQEIAQRLGRSEKSISARLFYMGLTREAPFSLRGK